VELLDLVIRKIKAVVIVILKINVNLERRGKHATKRFRKENNDI
jgi:hypothetical protein